MIGKSKYRAVRTGAFASNKEANRAQELQLLQKAGVINDLKYQVPYALIVKDELGRAVTYVADFEYFEKVRGDWNLVTEDVKGFKTPVYKLKRRLMFQKYGIKIRET